MMTSLIPKIKLSDKATWVQSEKIAISSWDLKNYMKYLTNEYFARKKIIVLPIIPDDYFLDLGKLIKKLITQYEKDRFVFVSNDCSCYNDLPEDCEEELEDLYTVNSFLFEDFLIDVGMLKGYNKETYEQTRKTLSDHVSLYMIYLTGEIRSNPKYFKVNEWLLNTFPNGLDKGVLLHGCPMSQFPTLKHCHLDIRGVITAGHIGDAIYRGNPTWKRETRIKKAWENWSTAFQTGV